MLRTTIIESSLPYTRPVHVVGVSHQDKSNFVDERKFENLMKQEYPVNRVSFPFADDCSISFLFCARFPS